MSRWANWRSMARSCRWRACCRRRCGARTRGRGLICPAASGGEAAWAGGLDVLAAPSLLALINHFKGTQILSPPAPASPRPNISDGLDLKDIKGQETAKRALEVAAAGGHNLLMIGPPGAGKSMLAARLPGMLPPLDPSEALEVSMIHSVAGLLRDGKLMRRRPFRDPHHSASLGRRSSAAACARKPGELSLAHLGVLFLDELPEFQRASLEALRQPMETGRAVRRARQRACDLSGARAARRGDESLPLRPSRRSGARLRPRAQMRAGLSVAHLGPALRPHRSAYRRAGGEGLGSEPAAAGRRLGRGGRARRCRPRAAKGAVRAPARGAAHPHQCRGRRHLARRDRSARSGGQASSSTTRPSACGFPRAAITACCAWRAPSPISMRATRCAASTSPRRCLTAGSVWAGERCHAAPSGTRLPPGEKRGG